MNNGPARIADCDVSEIERSLRLLIEPGQTFELRALGKERGHDVTWSGFFVDPAIAARVVPRVSQNTKGFYFTLNPVRPELRARRSDRLDKAAKGETTGDQHILRRTRLLVDIDAERPSGISASDAEHAAAIRLAETIARDLVGRGWPAPILADSGNGGHLVFGLDLPAEDDGLVARVLASAAERWTCTLNGITLKIDTTVANPARISKLYGTTTRKGDSVGDRVHRRARLISTPERLEPVPRDLLEAFAGPKVATPPKASPGAGVMRTLDVPEWLGRFGIAVKRSSPNRDGGAIYELETCPNNPDHDRGEAFVIQMGSGAISAGCHHESCRWDWAWLREKYEGPRDARTATPWHPHAPVALRIVKEQERPAPEDIPDVKDFKTSAERIRGESAQREALVARQLHFHHPFLDDLLRGILPHDLIILGASSGAGKTELAQGIAAGNALSGKRVHYFALEAEPLEIERRTKFKILGGLATAAGRDASGLNYPDWYRGKCERIVGDFNKKAEDWMAEMMSDLHTYYRGAHFGFNDVKRMLFGIKDATDLIVIDHLHYVDTESADENREYKDLVKMIRDVSLRIGRPILLVVHLRKRDKRYERSIVPDLESVHGSSDIYKVATHSIMLAPARDLPANVSWISNTFISVPKDRMGGSTGLVALCGFDVRTRQYAEKYTLGRSVGDQFEPLDDKAVPRWAKHHQPMYPGV